MRFEIASVDVTEMNPSLSVNAFELIVILPSADGDQVMEGSGTPLAVQLNVTIPVSFPITSMSSDGSVISTGAIIAQSDEDM